MFKILQDLVNKLNETNSTLEKKEKLRDIDLGTKQILYWIYNPFLQYNITSKNILKRSDIVIDNKLDIFELLRVLNTREATGHEAIGLVNGFINNNLEYKELILNIIDKDLKCRIGISIINDVFPNLIPEFNVALANSYNDVSDKINIFDGNWFASMKCDGCRNITIVNELGEVYCYSREGKEFLTLDVIKEEVRNLGIRSVVLDGELCIVDENGKEDFQSIMKVIRKKDYTIPNPKYKLFDMIPMQDFFNKESDIILSDRLNNLKEVLKNYNGNNLEVLEQKQIKSKEYLDLLIEEARSKEWEGLIVRKNTVYKGKRSNDLLKIKDFITDEYIVNKIDTGMFRYIDKTTGLEISEEMVTTIYINHKGCEVGVGSGFSIEDRKAWFNNNNLILNKIIEVKYFEETTTEKGVSLRFPTLKTVYGLERDT